MMGQQDRDQGQLFYEFKLDDVVPSNHLLRRMDVFVTAALSDLHQLLRPFYSEIGRPSVGGTGRGSLCAHKRRNGCAEQLSRSCLTFRVLHHCI